MAETETNKSNERQFCQLFWTTLLTEVLGIGHVAEFIDFERPVPKEFSSGKNFIDGYIASTKVLIEQKASKIDLSKGEKQSDGQYLTPYQQAKRYGSNQNYSERPRWIIVSNFVTFEIHDMERMDSEPYTIKLEDLPKELHNLSMIYDTGKKEIKEEMALSVEAGKIVDELYEILAKEYGDDSAEVQKSLNMLCVRLIFLLYADDAELFGRKGMFHDFVASYNAQNLRKGIISLFQNLNTKEENRDRYEDKIILEFPYVNGNLFSQQDSLIPQFNEEIKNLLLEKGNFNWKEISPTIFGAVFESTLNPETRHDGGMHYTSIENIHKVIDPLFLDRLNEKFENIKDSDLSVNKKKEKFVELQNEIASIKIFDPACGSGNFLTESFLCLRRLENKILQELNSDLSLFTSGNLVADDFIKVSIQQFYGIEINDFAVSVAKTALWIAEAQMFEEAATIAKNGGNFFPLETYNNIVEGNALRLDWEKVFPVSVVEPVETTNCYIIGNPPFLGKKEQTKVQKDELTSLFPKNVKGVGNLDYVSGWYVKALNLIKNTNVKCCFVSTNSITQGEQVPILWKYLIENGLSIDFAYRTFRWDSESTEKAHVHCVIIGFSSVVDPFDKLRIPPVETTKRIYTSDKFFVEAKNINAYLIDAPNIFIENRSKSICDVSEISYGSMPIDDGHLILSKEDVEELLKENSENSKFFKKYAGGDEILKNKDRWCLWLKDISPKEIAKSKFVMNRINETYEFRKSSNRPQTLALAETPSLFGEIRQPDTSMLVIPKVSSEKRRYIPIAFVNPEIIINGSALIIPNAELYSFGILMSNVHNAWMRVVAGRLETRYQYSGSIVYNNFPFPSQLKIENGKLKMQNGKWTLPLEDLPTDKTELSIINSQLKITNTAQAILDARAKYPDSSLGEMYSNILLYPELNKAHKENDKAVMEAYGFRVGMSESECVTELFRLYEKLTGSTPNT
ncbi:MAG: class I SAM-dependent DNA methyltransferase [Treponema sp.]|nr:class I SAM-dependent DNA methyltransferase [Candidatus Treponema equifaecale]